MIRRIGAVTEVSAVTKLDGSVSRSDVAAGTGRNGIEVYGTEVDLAATLDATAADGRLHDEASITLPTVVLGSVAAERLGITDVSDGPRVWIGGRWFSVIGILDPLPLNPDLDRAAMIGVGVARDLFGVKGLPSTIYIRTSPELVEQVRSVLGPTANPAAPNEVQVARPSDALAARAEVDQNLQRLLLGLGGVALLVGGVGIANVMIISVLERRAEIGVRRALGATRGHIRNQFVVESTLLALLGGLLGVACGYLVTAIYAGRQGWLVALPVRGLVLGVAAASANAAATLSNAGTSRPQSPRTLACAGLSASAASARSCRTNASASTA
jgi:putative ABC transport system permease protein